ncbi:hypothetical protein, partial [Bacillus tropicus]
IIEILESKHTVEPNMYQLSKELSI